MATVNDLVEASLRELGVLAGGETAGFDDADDGLKALNRLISQWATERLTIHSIARTTWTIVSGTQQYSVGASADVNVARPTYIDRITWIDTNTSPDTEYPLDALTVEAYAAVRLKAQTSTYPDSYFYNPTYPTGTLDLFPVPSATTLEGALYAPAQVSEFSALTTSVALPPGYERFIVKNLAMDLAPSYGTQPSSLLVDQAKESKTAIKRANIRMRDLHFDRGALIGHRQGGGQYDIRNY